MKNLNKWKKITKPFYIVETKDKKKVNRTQVDTELDKAKTTPLTPFVEYSFSLRRFAWLRQLGLILIALVLILEIFPLVEAKIYGPQRPD